MVVPTATSLIPAALPITGKLTIGGFTEVGRDLVLLERAHPFFVICPLLGSCGTQPVEVKGGTSPVRHELARNRHALIETRFVTRSRLVISDDNPNCWIAPGSRASSSDVTRRHCPSGSNNSVNACKCNVLLVMM